MKGFFFEFKHLRRNLVGKNGGRVDLSWIYFFMEMELVKKALGQTNLFVFYLFNFYG